MLINVIGPVKLQLIRLKNKSKNGIIKNANINDIYNYIINRLFIKTYIGRCSKWKFI